MSKDCSLEDKPTRNVIGNATLSNKEPIISAYVRESSAYTNPVLITNHKHPLLNRVNKNNHHDLIKTRPDTAVRPLGTCCPQRCPWSFADSGNPKVAQICDAVTTWDVVSAPVITELRLRMKNRS